MKRLYYLFTRPVLMTQGIMFHAAGNGEEITSKLDIEGFFEPVYNR